MNKFWLISSLCLLACQPALNAPQSFDDLLHITDETDSRICDLPLDQLRETVDTKSIDDFKSNTFDYEHVAKAHPNDPATQIRIIFRRAALKRRMNVPSDETDMAQAFYQSLGPDEHAPTSLESYHDSYHYWTDEIDKQGQYGEPDSVAYNIRFCVINEKRAGLHEASRKDIINRVDRGTTLPAPDLIENISHETIFDYGFEAKMLESVFASADISKLSAFELAEIRGRKAILPFDPKTATAFWDSRDEEIDSYLTHIESTEFSSPADKLRLMTDIDQSLRGLFASSAAQDHFQSPDEYDSFKEGLFTRLFKVDEFNTAQLELMLEGRGWFRDDKDGDGAGNLAWLIAQHADQKPEFQEKALKLIEAELGAPGVSKSNYAYLYDRVQVRFIDGDENSDRLQRYGTQGRCIGPGVWEPHPLEDPDRIDDLRAEVDLGPLEDYKARFKDICQDDER